MLNKAKLFDSQVMESEGKLGDKIIAVLVPFHSRMEELLVHMREVMGVPQPKPETVKVKEATPSKPPRPEMRLTSPSL